MTNHHFDGIVTIVGSGLRGAKRTAAKAHNARLRAALRPRDASGRFLVTSTTGRITNAVVSEDIEFEAWLVANGADIVPEGMVHVDQLNIEGGWVNTEDASHGHDGCPCIVGVWTVGNEAEHFMCPTCVHVPADAITAGTWAMKNIAPCKGDRECRVCNEVKPLKKFLTVVDAFGFRERNTMCSRCEESARDRNRAARQARRMAASVGVA